MAGGGLAFSSDKLKNEETADAEIKRIQAWVSKRAGRTHSDLLLDAIKSKIDNEDGYVNLQWKITKLVEYQDQRVVPIMVKCLDRNDVKLHYRLELLRYIRKLDAQAGLKHARKLHGKGLMKERSIAALIELDAGDAERAVELLDDLLQETDRQSMDFNEIFIAMKSLWATERDDARQVFLKQFSDDRLFLHGKNPLLPQLIRIALDAGEPSGLRQYRQILDNDTNSFAGMGYSQVISITFTENFIRRYDPDDPTLTKISETTEHRSNARVDALKQWMDNKLRAVDDKEDQTKKEDSQGASDVPKIPLPQGNRQ